MSKIFIFAGIAALGNAIFVYGQRSATVSPNPYLYMTGAISVCLIMFVTATLISSNAEHTSYLTGNLLPIIIGGVGFFITFVGFYLLTRRLSMPYSGLLINVRSRRSSQVMVVPLTRAATLS